MSVSRSGTVRSGVRPAQPVRTSVHMAEDDKTQDVEARESSVLSDILQLSGPCAPKEATVDPYVKVRCGKHTIWEQTQPVKNGGATPTWTTTHKNEVQLVRHGTDQV